MRSLAVLFLLERKTEHKVQLYFVPATVERLIRAIQDNFLCQSLIDDIAHPLGTGFRCKGQAALFYVLHLAHDIQRKGVDAQRRKTDIDILILKFIDQEIDDAGELRIITGA